MSYDEYTAGPAPHASPPVYTRVYYGQGTARYAHLITGSPGYADALCGAQVQQGGWFGTGSQPEYDRAARLPLCPRCFARRERQALDPRLGAGHGRDMREDH